MESLPLFPLGTVLFPGVELPLRIFEPRYVAMVTHLRRSGGAFGVVAIRRGREVGGTVPTLFDVGCSAVIDATVRHDDHMSIRCTARRRFRLDAVHEDRAPYLVADITWLDGEDDAPFGDELWQAREAFEDFVDAIGGRVEGLPMEPDPFIASALDGLGLPLWEQQDVLAAGGVSARLRSLGRACRRETALAEQMGWRIATVAPPSRLSPN